jgi:hypothetical protein
MSPVDPVGDMQSSSLLPCNKSFAPCAASKLLFTLCKDDGRFALIERVDFFVNIQRRRHV